MDAVYDCWFQQDDAPVQNTIAVRQYMSESLPRKWIGTYNGISCSPRTLGLTPLGFLGSY